jgi:hypothetical protein
MVAEFKRTFTIRVNDGAAQRSLRDRTRTRSASPD